MLKDKYNELLKTLDLSLRTEYLMPYADARIYLLREDKLNFSYGGNKLRLALELLDDISKSDFDTVISYGSPESNFNRIMADLCEYLGLECYILSSLSKEELPLFTKKDRKLCMNEILTQKAGAKRLFCEKSEVKEKLIKMFEELKEKGKRPYYIYGSFDGTGNDDLLQNAYFKVGKELFKKSSDYDNIVLAYGTGMSFEGLLKAKKALDSKIGLIGISVARDRSYTDEVSNTRIISEYIGEKYGSINENIKKLILDMDSKYNVALDPVYTGKAFFGLLSEIDKHNIEGKTLFIHTGGFPIYLDFIEEYKKSGVCL